MRLNRTQDTPNDWQLHQGVLDHLTPISASSQTKNSYFTKIKGPPCPPKRLPPTEIKKDAPHREDTAVTMVNRSHVALNRALGVAIVGVETAVGDITLEKIESYTLCPLFCHADPHFFVLSTLIKSILQTLLHCKGMFLVDFCMLFVTLFVILLLCLALFSFGSLHNGA